MPLTVLEPVQVPRPPRPEDLGDDPKKAIAGLTTWAANLSGILNTFIQQMQDNAVEPFSGSSANFDANVVTGDIIQANTIVAKNLIQTQAVITVAAQIQDAIISNAKITSLTSDKVVL